MLMLLSHADLVLLALAVLVFELPRYTISLVSLAALGPFRRSRPIRPPEGVTVSVIIPALNAEAELRRAITSLRSQTFAPLEIIVVDEGSTDRTRAIAEQARLAGEVAMVIHHPVRCGRSPAVNAGARFARGTLIMAMDPDTLLAPTALAHLVGAFANPRVAAASCNLGVANEGATLWTAIQDIEYVLSISAGRSFLNLIGAISCCSGACSMYRRDVFMAEGGLDVGPGEDLEFTLRLRRGGHLVRFVPESWAETSVPETALSLVRQRMRWDRDALRIRLVQYGELGLFRPFERLSDTLQRLDFIVFDLVPTLTFPFYLAYCVLVFGSNAALFLGAIYMLLLGIALFNIALAYVMFARTPTAFSLLTALVFPFYQGIVMKFVRFTAFTSEILFTASRNDDYVPPRVRRALVTKPV